MANAEIKWIKASEGGKKTVPDINQKYYPMLKIKDHDKIFNWSFVVVNLKNLDESTTFSQVYFLMDNAPNNVLVKDLEFSLYEGKKLIAKGIIL